jgi:hypothetical protein
MKANIRIYILSLVSLVAISGCVKGPKGDPGAPGGGRIISTINCGGTISGLVGAAGAALNGLEIEYDAVLTAGGDVYSTARVIDDLTQTTSTHFYARGQAGANDASVLIVADYDSPSNGGFWEISLDRNTLITYVDYTDSSLGVESPVNMSFTPSACTVQNW